jgi:maleylpyruvate isomerase
MSSVSTVRAGANPAPPADHAREGLTAVRRAGERLGAVLATVNADAARAPSRLPGWTRGHVLAHLARNADALVNMLAWAETGVERPAYASEAARDVDIEAGASRPLPALLEDVSASGARFLAAAAPLPAAAWETPIRGRKGPGMPAARIPWVRLNELLIHLVDLDRGVDFDEVVDLAGEQLPTAIEFAASRYAGRDVPAVRLDVSLPSGERLRCAFGEGEPAVVSGPAAAALSWITGRGDGAGLAGDLPALPAWL